MRSAAVCRWNSPRRTRARRDPAPAPGSAPRSSRGC